MSPLLLMVASFKALLAFTSLLTLADPPRAFESAGNPILADGSYYSADAAPLSHDGKLYIYGGHDEADLMQGGFVMYDYGVFVTDDPASGAWELHQANLDPDEVFSWATGDGAYAGHVARGPDGRFYWYAPVDGKKRDVPNSKAIGVAVADGPLGPWTDAIGEPLLSWTTVFKDSDRGQEVIDPHLFMDDDDRIYLYWGSWGVARVVELEPDMKTMKGEIRTLSGLDAFFEAPWVFKRGSTYYCVYDWKLGGTEYTPSNYQAAIAYATADSPLGPWTFQDVILSGTSSTTVHPSVIEHDGRWWVTYHTRDAEGGGHFRRAIAIDELTWDGGRMLPVKQTWAEPPQLKLTDNLAINASAEASYTKQPPMTAAALNDGRPTSVRLPPDTWGNYRGEDDTAESDWVQYTWDRPVRIGAVGIEFHRDGNWIRPPAQWSIEYRDDAGQWRAVDAEAYPTDTDVWHTVAFQAITTTALRAIFHGQPTGDNFYSVAVSEIEVIAVQADSIPEVHTQTTVGRPPKLPETIELILGGEAMAVPVVWKPVDPKQLSKVGTFKIEGRAWGQAGAYVTLQVDVSE